MAAISPGSSSSAQPPTRAVRTNLPGPLRSAGMRSYSWRSTARLEDALVAGQAEHVGQVPHLGEVSARSRS